MKSQIAIYAVALLLLAGCSAKPDVEVTMGANALNTTAFNIQAIGDEVTVKNIVINRGNCRLAYGTDKEMEKEITIFLHQIYRGYSSCSAGEIKEIEVTTDSGIFLFTF